MKKLSIQTEDDIYTVELRDLLSQTKYNKHYDIKAKFVTFSHSLRTGRENRPFKSSTYEYAGNNVKSYVMTPVIAMAFITYCDPAKGVDFIARTMEEITKLKHDKVMLLESKVKNNAKLLQAKDAVIDKMARKSISTYEGIVEKHKLLMSWVELGWVDHKEVKAVRNRYTITPKGKAYLIKVSSHIERKG